MPRDGPRPIDKHVGTKLRLRRTKLGMSQSTLACPDAQRSDRGTGVVALRTRNETTWLKGGQFGLGINSRRSLLTFFAAREAGYGPVPAPPPSTVASGRWGAPVAGVMWPTADGCDRLTHAIGYSIASSTRR